MGKEIDKFIITPATPLKSAMRQLDTSMRKIVFVVNGRKQLIGALTDGDIRRWLLAGGGVDSTIEKVYNRKPLVYPQGIDMEVVKKAMLSNRASCIPIVDNQKRIVDLIFWQELFGAKRAEAKKKLTLPVVIMAGGKGVRLDPFTRVLPKPLIPVGDSTMLEVIIEKFLPHKINDFYISVNYKASIIKAYFDDLDTSYRISFLHEKKFLGTAGGLKALQGKLTQTFLLTNCDTIIDTDYFSLVKFHESKENDITIVASMMHHTIKYGVCEITAGGNLKKLTEKPEYSFLANTGMYLINPKLLRLIPRNEMFHVTDLIKKAQSKGARVGVYPVGQGDWIDTGEWAEYKNALQRLLI